ncbi:hypothetical protein AB1Y20_003398 [Prymnesium parvum]|uniref:PDZ domain-containing protein n=1 Tax=Prymnesium parvum TaxID=97485 RepID=A0AB34JEC9_PRYPA
MTGDYAVSRMTAASEVCSLRLYKPEKGTRVGLSFEPDGPRHAVGRLGARVESVQPYGLAAKAGLKSADLVLSINGMAIANSLNAATMLRESVGEVLLSMQRPASSALTPAGGAHSTRSNQKEHFTSAPHGRGPPPSPCSVANTRDGHCIRHLFHCGLQCHKSLLEGIGQWMEAVLLRRERDAATKIQASWRGRQSRIGANHLGTLRTERMLTETSRRHASATIVAKCFRGFVDRNWVALSRQTIRAEMQRRASEALTAPEARVKPANKEDKVLLLNGTEKVKRAFSFRRKQRKDSRPSSTPGSPSLGAMMQAKLIPSDLILRQSIGCSSPVRERQAASPSSPVSIKRTFSWGRKKEPTARI